MELTYAVIVSIAALILSIYQFTRNTHQKSDTQITTVLIKLESIIESMTEIKADMRSMKAEMKEDMQDVKSEVQDLRERLAKVEASAASAHKRLDTAIGAQKDR